jgi:hypothetical protein
MEVVGTTYVTDQDDPDVASVIENVARGGDVDEGDMEAM